MKFTSFFNPVNLPSDPLSAENGSLYFNSASNVYRYYESGSWVSVINSSDTIYNVGHKIFHYGEGEDSYTFDLEQQYSNAVLHFEGEGSAMINLPLNSRIPIAIGSSFKIVKASAVDMDISFDVGVTFNLASSIYLKAIWDSAIVTKIKENEWILEAEFRDLY
jgi:hypothetical protein